MMEQQFSNEPLLDLQIDYDSGNKFNEATRWAKFLAIICFVGIGLMLLWVTVAGFAIRRAFSTIMGGADLDNMGGILIAVVIVVLGIATFVMILLYRFATLVKRSIQIQDQAMFDEGLRNLKNYFLINGILGLLGLVVNLLGLVGNIF